VACSNEMVNVGAVPIRGPLPEERLSIVESFSDARWPRVVGPVLLRGA